MYLLDTNIIIYSIKQKPAGVLEMLKKNMQHDLFVSSITLAELEFGVENSNFPEKNRLALSQFLSLFKILAYDEFDAQIFGKIKYELKKTGQLIGPYDLLIASQAISKKLILVTNNTKEFIRIENLMIENWV